MTGSTPSPLPPGTAWFLTVMIVVYAVLDVGIAAVFGPLAATAPEPEQAAAFALLGGSALAGVPIVVLAAVAAARLARGRPGARSTAVVAGGVAAFRVLAILVAFAIITAVVGVAAQLTTIPLLFLAVTLFDGCAAGYIASRVRNRS